MGRRKGQLSKQTARHTKKDPGVQKSSSRGKDAGSQVPIAIDDKYVTWGESSLDLSFDACKCDWNLSHQESRQLLELLASLQGQTWKDVKALKFNSKSRTRALHHSQPVDSICKTARDRLTELELDLEQVFRFRHGNKLRLWGYTQGAKFYILWFDRDHKVCPTE